MSTSFWDERYQAREFAYGTAPNDFLVENAAYLPPRGRLLLPADGEGRNSVWLAERGYRPTAVDFSSVGLEKARTLAAERGVAIETVHTDLTDWDWPEDTFDGVVAVFCHLPPGHRQYVHRAMLGALRPGGRLLLEAYTPDQLAYRTGGPPVEEMLYSRAALEEDFAGAAILHLEEKVRPVMEGKYHHGDGAVIQLVAERPA
ncbi:class I SAM-dependent methyltransferase [Thiohalorhabdus sp. Cl-TMA]|uniref:Class I SAM-dependent methyltransferase n=1 Tax=Thiohalorhabdus methylotrophus TaxID=3242694 RepID=A0ABV4U173_9GAMM